MLPQNVKFFNLQNIKFDIYNFYAAKAKTDVVIFNTVRHFLIKGEET